MDVVEDLGELQHPPPNLMVKLDGQTARVALRDRRFHPARKEAWSFYRIISDVRLCWELEEPKGPRGPVRPVRMNPTHQPQSLNGKCETAVSILLATTTINTTTVNLIPEP